MRRFIRYGLALAFLLTIAVLPAPAAAESQKSFALEAAAGFPQLLGLDLAYVGFRNVEVGLGFGFAPINNTVNAKVGLHSMSVNLGLSDSYQLDPHANFSLNSFSPFIRVYPWAKNFYLQLALTVLRAGATITGDLIDTTSGQVTPGVLSGSLDFVETALNLSLGYRTFLGSSLFLDAGAGLVWLQSVTDSLSVGGSLASLSSVTPSGQAQFDQTVSSIQNQIDATVSRYKSNFTFLPSVFLALGYAF